MLEQFELEKERNESRYGISLVKEDGHYKIFHKGEVMAVFMEEKETYYFLSGFVMGCKKSEIKFSL